MPARSICTDASQVRLHEANDGCKAYPQCCIRLAAYDSVKQVQVMSFLVRKPGLAAATSSCPPAGRWLAPQARRT